MARFRRKPFEIEAWQWFGDEAAPGVCMCEAYSRGNPDGALKPHLHTAHEGQMVRLAIGDWITEEGTAPGRFYPIRADVMAANFEPIE